MQKTRGLYFCNVLKNVKRKTLQTSLQALKRQKAVGVVGHVNEKPILSQVLKQLNCKKSAASITQPNKIPTDSVTQPPDTEQVEPIEPIDNIIQPVSVVKSVEKECGNCDRLNVVLQKQQKLISQYKEKMKAYEEKIAICRKIRDENTKLSAVIKSGLISRIPTEKKENLQYAFQDIHPVVR